jgi:hypothetical protein
MISRTNTLVTDIFVTLLQCKCGIPQGNGFLVEIENLYAMPVNPTGTIAPSSHLSVMVFPNIDPL